LLLKIYLINFRYKTINFFKNPTNIEEFERIKYICDKIILIIGFEKLHIYFKTKVVGGIFGKMHLW